MCGTVTPSFPNMILFHSLEYATDVIIIPHPSSTTLTSTAPREWLIIHITLEVFIFLDLLTIIETYNTTDATAPFISFIA
jgi:hypothetical protein